MTSSDSTEHLEAHLAHMEARLQQRERQLNAIQRVNEALALQTSVDELVRIALNEAVAVADADVGSFQVYNAEDDTLVFQHVLEPEGAHLIGYATPASQGISGDVFRTGKSRLTSEVRNDRAFNREVDAKTGYQSQSMVTVPIKPVGAPPIGVMQVLNATRPFDQDDVEVLEVLCSYAATAIETRRLAEEARKAQIVSVLGDVSHDIKNMLTPIQSGLWMLKPWLDQHFGELRQMASTGNYPPLISSDASLALEENYDWILDSALDAAERVQTRTKELADVVKGEVAPPIFSFTDVNTTTRRVAELLRPVAQEAGITLTLDLDPALTPVEVDEKQLYNALYNLVNNAIPETASGGQVWIRTFAPSLKNPSASIDASCFKIQVQDTGRGMTPEVSSRLFTDAAISTKPGGTGLGTRIVAGVVRRHQGTIDVDSAEGVGTTFTITLPRYQHPQSLV